MAGAPQQAKPSQPQMGIVPPPAPVRPVHVFTSKLGTIELVELTADEELDAAKRSRSDNVRLAFEMAKTSLVGLNGAKLSLADGSADKAWNEMGSRLRNLVMRAYSDIHTPPEEDANDFLQSRKVKVG
jgi:hypothetical protein